MALLVLTSLDIILIKRHHHVLAALKLLMAYITTLIPTVAHLVQELAWSI